MNESMERGFIALPALVALDVGIVVAALFLSSPLAFIAALLAGFLTIGRYLSMAAYARGIGLRRWFFPLSLWIAFFGLLALLLYLAGRKGVLLWPALVALSGPTVFLFVSLARALGALARGGPFRPIAADPALAEGEGAVS